MSPRVYITSRGRPDNVRKLLPAWEAEGFSVYFMVEPDEAETYRAAIDSIPHTNSVTVLSLPDKNLGVGYSRADCLAHAQADGQQSVLLSDDDVKPYNGGMESMLEFACGPRVLGVTAWHDYIDFALGVKGKERTDAIISPSIFMRIWALNIDNVLSIGGIDRSIKCIDDAELKFRAHTHGYPWVINFGAKVRSFAKRYAEGGVNLLGDNAIDVATDQILDKHRPHLDSGLIRRGGKPEQVKYNWVKIHDRFMPGWRNWSEKHGGNIANYFTE